MNEGLASLLANSRVWRARQAPASLATVSTGYPALDAHLPGGGWPLDLLTEFLLERPGLGELSLVIPALTRLQEKARAAGRTDWIVWVAPPMLPYAPALSAAGLDPGSMLVVRAAGDSAGGKSDSADVLWAMEQAVLSGHSAAVLGWPERADDRQMRRLQLAAQKGGIPVMLFRSLCPQPAASAAALRLRLVSRPGGVWLEALKSRGGRPFSLPLDNLLHA